MKLSFYVLRKACAAAVLTAALAALSPCAALAAVTTMHPGDEGTAVELLQEALQDKGYYTYPQITGYYGAETEQAVVDFQRAVKLGGDGVAGKYTLQALFGKNMESILKNATLKGSAPSLGDSARAEETRVIEYAPAPNLQQPSVNTGSGGGSDNSSVLKNGMKGDAVRSIQRRLAELGYLSSSADGEYGSGTEQAVRMFQQASGILSDGEAGPMTIAALNARDAVPYALVSLKIPAASSLGEAAVDLAKQFLGVKYVYGTAGPGTFDCSGLTLYVYKRFGIDLPHTTRLQGTMGTYLSRGDLSAGDLVFFDTVAGNGLQYDHVGIYISGGMFVHAASGGAGQVTISSLDSGYYKNTFVCGRRLV